MLLIMGKLDHLDKPKIDSIIERRKIVCTMILILGRIINSPGTFLNDRPQNHLRISGIRIIVSFLETFQMIPVHNQV